MGLEFCVSSLVFRGAGFWLYTNFIRESVKEHLGFFSLNPKTGPVGKEDKIY